MDTSGENRGRSYGLLWQYRLVFPEKYVELVYSQMVHVKKMVCLEGSLIVDFRPI